MPHTVSLDELEGLVGRTLGPCEPIRVTQDTIDAFADATGDHQWIHVDTERAASGPFGGTIAHGFLTLSLTPVFLAALLEVEQVGSAVNYGLDRCRFPSPVPSGSELAATLTVREVTPVAGGGKRAHLEIAARVPGAAKPAAVSTLLVDYYPA